VEYTPYGSMTSIVAVVAPRTGKIIKNGLSVSERGENKQMVNYTLCLDSVRSQKSRWKVRI